MGLRKSVSMIGKPLIYTYKSMLDFYVYIVNSLSQPPIGASGGSGCSQSQDFDQRSTACWSLWRPSTQRCPSGVSSFFQKGARVFR